MSGPRIGSLFSGYGGLDAAVSAVTGGETAWVSDIDKGACKILAHRYPDVPNIGDVTAVDWSQVEPIDVLTGGFPCQDVSSAGKRAGMRPDTRSGLWTQMAYAIAQLRPGLVVIENVRGLLSAEAHSEVEPCSWCMGEAALRGPDLRALGAVLGDLASIGYDASWHGIRAADVGASHGRFRVFVVAYPERGGLDGWASDTQRAPVGRVATAGGSEVAGVTLLSTPQSRDYKGVPGDGFNTANLARDVSLLPTPAVNDMGEGRTVEARDEWTATMQAKHGNGNGHGKSLSIEAQRLLPTPKAHDGEFGTPRTSGRPPEMATHLATAVEFNITRKQGEDDGIPAEGRPCEGLRDVRGAIDPQEVRERATRGQERISQEAALLATVREQSQGDSARQSQMADPTDCQGSDVRDVQDSGTTPRSPHRPEPREQPTGQPQGRPSAACGCNTDWGQYTDAIRRWERILGRAAPSPTQLSTRGRPQLDARFSEFLMGLPAGWVTDVPGITRNEALKAIGNGVCPQQCEAALRFLLASERAA